MKSENKRSELRIHFLMIILVLPVFTFNYVKLLISFMNVCYKINSCIIVDLKFEPGRFLAYN